MPPDVVDQLGLRQPFGNGNEIGRLAIVIVELCDRFKYLLMAEDVEMLGADKINRLSNEIVVPQHTGE